MENDVKQRIREVLLFHHVSITKLSCSISAAQRRYTRQINDDAALTCETILEVLDRFGDISAEWLLRGKGDMFITQSEPKNIQVGDKNVNVQNDKDIITLLIEQNKHLQDESKEKTAQIDRLLALLSNR